MIKQLPSKSYSLLNSEGFIVTHVSTRSEALAEIAKNKFDLALIDISLPDGNGVYDLVQKSKKSKTFLLSF